MGYFQAECVDRQTGRTFLLRLLGSDADEARSVPMGWGFIIATPEPVRPAFLRSASGGSSMRGGQIAPRSAVCDATQSQSLDQMLELRYHDCHAIERHFFLQQMAELGYKQRQNRSDALTWSEWACWQWLMEAPILIEAMRQEFSTGRFVHVVVPKRLVIILEKSGHMERALDVARTCAVLNLAPDDIQYLAIKAERITRSLDRR